MTTHLIDVSHTVEHGMITYKGLPAPVICDFLSREASRSHYAPGTEFLIGRIDMVANTGTYVDSPFHRFADGADLAGLPLNSLANLDELLVRVRPMPAAPSRPPPLQVSTSAAKPCWSTPAGRGIGAPTDTLKATHS